MTDSNLQQCVALLSDLIGYRTENPGGDELALCERLADELRNRSADAVHLVEVPRPGREPGGYVFARYGNPRLLLNVHLDTVPANTGWTFDPFVAEVVEGGEDGEARLYGLGSADTKGAIAAALTVLSGFRPKDVGILFSGDEENGTHCVAHFVESEHLQGIERALICEPTNRRVGIRHRGVRAYNAQVAGRGGHSSKADFMPKPVVTMARLAVALDELGISYLDQGPEDMRGLCMNVAAIDGGVAFNVVPDSAGLRFSVRPPPGFDSATFEQRIRERAHAIDGTIGFGPTLSAEPFACGDEAWFRQLLDGRVADFVPLDFWTEAAIVQAHGVDAVVVGPGDIATAHAPDEYVPLADLSWAIELFGHALANHGLGGD